MTLPIAEFATDYEDLYRLEVPATPPQELRKRMGGDQPNELTRQLAAPKVQHVVRLVNNGGTAPLTTAPALITRNGRVVAQGMMRYTPAGAKTDIDMTTAVNVQYTRDENETGRTPNAYTWRGELYNRIELAGQVHLMNFEDKPVTIEVTRYVPGHADKADGSGKIVQTGLLGR